MRNRQANGNIPSILQWFVFDPLVCQASVDTDGRYRAITRRMYTLSFVTLALWIVVAVYTEQSDGGLNHLVLNWHEAFAYDMFGYVKSVNTHLAVDRDSNLSHLNISTGLENGTGANSVSNDSTSTPSRLEPGNKGLIQSRMNAIYHIKLFIACVFIWVSEFLKCELLHYRHSTRASQSIGRGVAPPRPLRPTTSKSGRRGGGRQRRREDGGGRDVSHTQHHHYDQSVANGDINTSDQSGKSRVYYNESSYRGISFVSSIVFLCLYCMSAGQVIVGQYRLRAQPGSWLSANSIQPVEEPNGHLMGFQSQSHPLAQTGTTTTTTAYLSFTAMAVLSFLFIVFGVGDILLGVCLFYLPAAYASPIMCLVWSIFVPVGLMTAAMPQNDRSLVFRATQLCAATLIFLL